MSFVRGTPVKYVDPSGYSVDCAIGEFGCQAGKLSRDGIEKLYDDAYDLSFTGRDPRYWTSE